ncbi:MAG: chlorite dismutase family protein [Phycisphaeraceae bacterium]
MERRVPEKPDLSEKGGPKDGRPQSLDRRLFMQLLAFGDCRDTEPLIDVLEASALVGALYADVNDPRGVALLTISEDPVAFVGPVRGLLLNPPFDRLVQKPHYTMLGRSYSIGYEADLEETLIHRPMRTALNRDWPWVVWYPLRRSGAFTQLPPEEQRAILGEHGQIGFAFGAADYGHDIRLASYGLDQNDNDFVVGLVGKGLHPLSALVQAMRKTKQTSQYLERLGPFFVGRAIWQRRQP